MKDTIASMTGKWNWQKLSSTLRCMKIGKLSLEDRVLKKCHCMICKQFHQNMISNLMNMPSTAYLHLMSERHRCLEDKSIGIEKLKNQRNILLYMRNKELQNGNLSKEIHTLNKYYWYWKNKIPKDRPQDSYQDKEDNYWCNFCISKKSDRYYKEICRGDKSRISNQGKFHQGRYSNKCHLKGTNQKNMSYRKRLSYCKLDNWHYRVNILGFDLLFTEKIQRDNQSDIFHLE